MPFSVTSGRRMIWCGCKLRVACLVRVGCHRLSHRHRSTDTTLVSCLAVRAEPWLRTRRRLRAAAARFGSPASSRPCSRNGVQRRTWSSATAAGRSTFRAFNSATGDTDTSARLRMLLYTFTSCRPWPPAGCCRSSFSALRMRGHLAGLRLRRSAKLVDQRHLVVGELARPGPCAWPAAGPSSAGGTTSRGAAWRGCVRRRGECRCGASRPGRCPSPSADTSSSSCRPLRRGSWSCAVPCRRLFWYITTASCSNCLLIRGARSAGSISYLPTSAPVRL